MSNTNHTATLQYILKAIYPSVMLFDESYEGGKTDSLSIEQIINIVILATIFFGYFFKFILVLVYFIVYRGLRKIGIFIINFFRAKCCLNCKKICNESLKDFMKTMKKLFTYNFFLYSNFFYGFYITFIFLLFVITHFVFSFQYKYIETPKVQLGYLLFSYEASILFEITCITFFIIQDPFIHVLISSMIFILINITIFVASLFQASISTIVVTFFVKVIYLILILFVLKTIYQFDYNNAMLRKLLREKNDYYLQKYNKTNPIYIKELSNMEKVTNNINLKGYYSNYQESYFFFYRNRYYNKRRLIVFYIILFLEKVIEMIIDICLISLNDGKDRSWARKAVSFLHNILVLYIAVSTFLKGEIQYKYIC